jgi:hypothetical protein
MYGSFGGSWIQVVTTLQKSYENETYSANFPIWCKTLVGNSPSASDLMCTTTIASSKSWVCSNKRMQSFLFCLTLCNDDPTKIHGDVSFTQNIHLHIFQDRLGCSTNDPQEGGI